MKRSKSIFSMALMSLTFAMAFHSMAQEGAWSIGPEAGINISRLGHDAGTNDFKAGALGGIFMTYSVKNAFAITTKLLYSQRGAYFKSSDMKLNLNYIEIPILARFFFNKTGTFRPNIFAGPSFGFLTDVTYKVGSNERVNVTDYDTIYNRFDFGITGGVGFNFRVADKTYFIVDARYTRGLSDVSKAAGTVNNNSLGLTAGVSFKF